MQEDALLSSDQESEFEELCGSRLAAPRSVLQSREESQQLPKCHRAWDAALVVRLGLCTAPRSQRSTPETKLHGHHSPSSPARCFPPPPPRLSTRCQPVSPRAAGQGLVPGSKGRNGTGATGCFRALCPCLVRIFPPHQLREQLSLCPGQGCVCSPGVHHQQRARSRLCFPEAGCRRGARQLSCPPHAARQPTSCCVCRQGGENGDPRAPPQLLGTARHTWAAAADVRLDQRGDAPAAGGWGCCDRAVARGLLSTSLPVQQGPE